MRILVTGSCELTHPAQVGTLELEARAESATGDAREAMRRASAAVQEIAAECDSGDAISAAAPGGREDPTAPGITARTVGAPVTTWWTDPSPRVRISIPLSVTAEDPVLLGRLAAHWGSRDEVLVTGARWDLRAEMRSRLQDEALRGALADARHRGEVLAEPADDPADHAPGRTPEAPADRAGIRVVEIEDRSGPAGPAPFLLRSAAGGMGEEDAPLVISPEPVIVRAEVRAVLEPLRPEPL